MGGDKLSLPRLKDWKLGRHQLGVFYRTPSGQYLYIVADRAHEAEVVDAHRLLKTMSEATAARNKTEPPEPKPDQRPVCTRHGRFNCDDYACLMAG